MNSATVLGGYEMVFSSWAAGLLRANQVYAWDMAPATEGSISDTQVSHANAPGSGCPSPRCRLGNDGLDDLFSCSDTGGLLLRLRQLLLSRPLLNGKTRMSKTRHSLFLVASWHSSIVPAFSHRSRRCLSRAPSPMSRWRCPLDLEKIYSPRVRGGHGGQHAFTRSSSEDNLG